MTIEELIRAGRKIEAIKVYREQTGVGLKEAKDAVEAIERGQPAPFKPVPAMLSPLHSSTVENLVRGGRKIEAIKVYREQTGVGLKEAKDAIDALQERMLGR